MTNHLILLCGKSGVGKSSIESVLWKLGYITTVSYTDRQPRQSEINGIDYNFVSSEEFESMINNGEMLEYTARYGNLYGTAKSSIDLSKGDHVIAVDPTGYFKLKECFNDSAVGIYIYIEDHERLIRLLSRDENVEKSLKRYFADNETFKEAEGKIAYKVHNIDIKTSANTINNFIMRSIRLREDQ